MLAERRWAVPFLQGKNDIGVRRALIILNQPFSEDLLYNVWKASDWHCCADGGANRLHDVLGTHRRKEFIPDLIKGDFDSLRDDVRQYYEERGVKVFHDPNQYSTDLMKCIAEIVSIEERTPNVAQFELVILGGLSGRLDQTVHTLHYLHKLRKERRSVFAVTDDNIAWILDEGEHIIEIDHRSIGPTCGLLPVGVDSTILTTRGLQWNLDNVESSFDGLVSTSNAVAKGSDEVFISTSKPIWWCIELQHTPQTKKSFFSSKALYTFCIFTTIIVAVQVHRRQIL